MNQIKKILAMVAAILLPLFVLAGTVISEIYFCKTGAWFEAVMYLFVFCFAAMPIYNIVEKLWNYFLPDKKKDVVSTE